MLDAKACGESVQCGNSLASMHWETMYDGKSVNRRNILGSRFDEFGCGVAVGRKDGKLYACQLFRSAE